MDPGYVDTSAALAEHWDLRLTSRSSVRNVGDPTLLDADGTRSDIGAFGGAGGDDG